MRVERAEDVREDTLRHVRGFLDRVVSWAERDLWAAMC